jgi:hypothetical protein
MAPAYNHYQKLGSAVAGNCWNVREGRMRCDGCRCCSGLEQQFAPPLDALRLNNEAAS